MRIIKTPEELRANWYNAWLYETEAGHFIVSCVFGKDEPSFQIFSYYATEDGQEDHSKNSYHLPIRVWGLDDPELKADDPDWVEKQREELLLETIRKTLSTKEDNH